MNGSILSAYKQLPASSSSVNPRSPFPAQSILPVKWGGVDARLSFFSFPESSCFWKMNSSQSNALLESIIPTALSLSYVSLSCFGFHNRWDLSTFSFLNLFINSNPKNPETQMHSYVSYFFPSWNLWNSQIQRSFNQLQLQYQNMDFGMCCSTFNSPFIHQFIKWMLILFLKMPSSYFPLLRIPPAHLFSTCFPTCSKMVIQIVFPSKISRKTVDNIGSVVQISSSGIWIIFKQIFSNFNPFFNVSFVA